MGIELSYIPRNGIMEVYNLVRNILTVGAPKSELTKGVVSPYKNLAVIRQSSSVAVATRN